jgi:hypothetical protein
MTVTVTASAELKCPAALVLNHSTRARIFLDLSTACLSNFFDNRERHFLIEYQSYNPVSVLQRQRLPTSASAIGGSLMAVEKTLRLESTERFPLSHRHYHGVLE